MRIEAGMSVIYTDASGREHAAHVVRADDLYRAYVTIPATGQALSVSYARLGVA